MKISKEEKIKKSLKDLDFLIEFVNEAYVPHISEPSLDEINKSYKYIKNVLYELVNSNFGKLKKQKIIK